MTDETILKLFNSGSEDKKLGVYLLCSRTEEEVLEFFKKHHGSVLHNDPHSTDYWIPVGGKFDEPIKSYYKKGDKLYICVSGSHVLLDLPGNAKDMINKFGYKIVEEFK